MKTLLAILCAAALCGCCSKRHDIVTRSEYTGALMDYCRAVDSVNHYRRIAAQQQHVIDSLTLNR